MSEGLGRFRHIAVEGVIGAGKSTLASQLAGRLGAELLLEQADENPFLGRFYADMKGYALQTQLFFLFQRQKQLQAIAQPMMFSSSVVSDFMFAKDTIFAQLTLSDDEYRLYAQMYAAIATQLPAPDLVIWLQASPETALDRVRQRGIVVEHGIELDYLQRLDDGYARHFARQDTAPVFVVDSEAFDLRPGRGQVDRLLEALAVFDGRRGSLDPGPALLN
ncbi:MAG: deoxynucleoside kinase [Caldimonas sp.]